ncbi:MAG: hypothetical protein ACLFSB_03180 [Chitinispirillaceae bacterium]
MIKAFKSPIQQFGSIGNSIRYGVLLIYLLIGIFAGCDFPYQPEPEKALEGIASYTNAGTIYPINSGSQICNPSISLHPDYAGCMLWLNFSGALNVRVPDSLSGYTTDRGSVRMHDRLTLTDSSNTVRWYVMNTDLGLDPDKQLQDPEWTTHPDYITCLSERSSLEWAASVVRVSDHAVIHLTSGVLDEISTPHVWIEPAAHVPVGSASPVYDENGLADRESVEDFFGTANVKLVYTKLVDGDYRLFFVDYSSSKLQPLMLPKPSGAQDYAVESPLISPDGNWILFNAASQMNRSGYASYAQRLQAESTPYLVSEDAAAPHWWVHPSMPEKLYVVYARIEGNYSVSAEYTAQLEASGAAGQTYKQEVMAAGSSDLAHHASFALIGKPQSLVGLPFKGGLSPDSRFLCTGYDNGYIMYLR